MAIFGVRTRVFGQTDYCSAPDDCCAGDYVLVQAENGPRVARLETGPLTVLRGACENELPQVVRIANEEDLEIHARNEILAREAFAFCVQCIRSRKLDMKLVEVEVFHDRSKFIFYFTAPSRVDFRELVKDLVHEYRSRIELRQIGVRHESQRLGAIGNCGRVCCCRGFLRKFAPVTIRMAKEQNLFLNPAKISGICGRLLCCLSYEQENYENFHHEAPRPGKKYSTRRGPLRVLRANMFANSVTAVSETNEELEIPMDEWVKMCQARAQGESVKPASAGPDSLREAESRSRKTHCSRKNIQAAQDRDIPENKSIQKGE